MIKKKKSGSLKNKIRQEKANYVISKITNLSKLMCALHFRLSLLSLGNGDEHVVAVSTAQDHGRLRHLVKNVLQITDLQKHLNF